MHTFSAQMHIFSPTQPEGVLLCRVGTLGVWAMAACGVVLIFLDPAANFGEAV